MNTGVFWFAALGLFVRALPAHLMAYFPFRERLRFPLWAALLPVSLIQMGQSLLYGLAVARVGSGRAIEYGFALVYMAIYFFSVRDNREKVLFLYLFVTDYVLILRGMSVFVEARFFFRPSMGFDSGISILLNLTALAASAPFMLRLLANAREKVFLAEAPGFWRTAWMVPAFTTAIVLLFTYDFTPENVRSFRFLFARVLLLLCALVIYSSLLDALDAVRRAAALAERAETQEQLLNLQRMQQERLLRHSEEIKAARHDLRQHLSVIWAYLDENDVDGLKGYLTAYEGKLPPDIKRTFTKNFALNAVCTRYAEEAREYGIDYDAALDLPEQLPMNEPEVCALLGNLLENAVEACREIRHAAPFIRVRGAWEDGHLVFAVDNACETPPRWEGGRLRSTKRDGLGTGTWTIQKAAERCGGIAEFMYRDGVFYASVFLYG